MQPAPQRKIACECVLAARFDQVPRIAVQVLENHHLAVGLVTRRLAEFHALGLHVCIVAVEIAGLEEQEYAPAGLPANRRLLLRRIRVTKVEAQPVGKLALG